MVNLVLGGRFVIGDNLFQAVDDFFLGFESFSRFSSSCFLGLLSLTVSRLSGSFCVYVFYLNGRLLHVLFIFKCTLLQGVLLRVHHFTVLVYDKVIYHIYVTPQHCVACISFLFNELWPARA